MAGTLMRASSGCQRDARATDTRCAGIARPAALQTVRLTIPPLRRKTRGLIYAIVRVRRSFAMRLRWFFALTALAAVLLTTMQAQVRRAQASRNPAADWPMYNRDLA